MDARDPLEAVPPSREPGGLPPRARDGGGVDAHAVIAEALRALVQARSAVEVADAVLDAVRRLGGATIPADEVAEGAFPVDVSFGVGPPVVPWAAPGPLAWQRRQEHLPRLVEDARAAADRVRERETLAREAELDPLTGLGSRRAYHRVLARVGAGDVLVALDLDRFKPVNDEHGHTAGDELLTGFAAALRDQVRATDHAFRIGGDEFAVVLRGTDVGGARRRRRARPGAVGAAAQPPRRVLRRHRGDRRPRGGIARSRPPTGRSTTPSGRVAAPSPPPPPVSARERGRSRGGAHGGCGP